MSGAPVSLAGQNIARGEPPITPGATLEPFWVRALLIGIALVFLTLFLFVLFSNLLGLLPKSFTTTSHVAVTVTLALIVFLFVTLLGLARKGVGFLGMFWVSSAPLLLRPVLAVIEIISYFVRPVSHSIRLAGNLMAGHAVMKVFAGFASMAVISPVAIGAVSAIYGLELLVAVVQAYVFTILTCVYLKDAVGDAHH